MHTRHNKSEITYLFCLGTCLNILGGEGPTTFAVSTMGDSADLCFQKIQENRHTLMEKAGMHAV